MTDGGTQSAGTPSIPQPRVGAGSADLMTESQDANELRDLLARARERLSFYESFDRIIGENIKRSGELMLETIQLREQADVNARDAAKVNAEFDTRLTIERKRHRDLLAGLVTELDGLETQLDVFRSKLQSTLSAIDGIESLATPASSSQESSAEMASEPGAKPPKVDMPAPAKSIDLTKTIDALFHGIPDPGTALLLQRHLNAVDSVSNVEAREFAEGILRLQVTSTRPLLASDFATWRGSRAIRVLREQPNVIEATLVE